MTRLGGQVSDSAVLAIASTLDGVADVGDVAIGLTSLVLADELPAN